MDAHRTDIGELRHEMQLGFARVDGRMDAMQASFNGRMDTMQASFDGRMDAMSERALCGVYPRRRSHSPAEAGDY